MKMGEMQQLKEEIIHVNGWILHQSHSQNDVTVYKRILSRLQSALTAAERGMKVEIGDGHETREAPRE